MAEFSKDTKIGELIDQISGERADSHGDRNALSRMPGVSDGDIRGSGNGSWN